MSLPSLPLEVIDRIIDTVAEDARCRETLRVCSQVAHVFVQRAHHHLFSHFTFPQLTFLEKTSAGALRMLLQILRDGSQFPGMGIVNHTRHLHFHGGLFSQLQEGHNLAAIFKLFHAINRIQSLTIWLPMSFLRLGKECCASLIALCRSPTLKALTVHNLFDIPKYLLHGSHIKRVKLSNFEFLSYPSDEPKILYQPESIATHSSRFHSLLDAFHAGGGEIERSTRYTEALAFLKELDLTIGNVQDIPSCLDTASFAGAVLKEIKLEINIRETTPKSTPTYPFHRVPNLRTLNLVFGLSRPCLKPVKEFLELSILPPSLDKLVLSVRLGLHFAVSEDGMLSFIQPNDIGWNLLDAILTRSPVCALPLVILNLLYSVQMVTPRCKLDNDTLTKCIRESVLRDRLPPFNSSTSRNFVLNADVFQCGRRTNIITRNYTTTFL